VALQHEFCVAPKIFNPNPSFKGAACGGARNAFKILLSLSGCGRLGSARSDSRARGFRGIMELGPTADESAWAGRFARTPFASALAKGASLFVASGEPPHVIFATPAALAAFGAPDLQALDAALLANDGLA